MDKTVEEIVQAMEKNGYEQIKGEFVAYAADGITPVAGCAIGQAALNLGIDWRPLNEGMYNSEIRRTGVTSDKAHLNAYIMYLNDQRGKTLPEIAALVRRYFKKDLNTTINIYTGE